MTVYAAPGSTFEANVANGTTGQVGTIGVRISNLATQTDFLARTTAGITEFPAASGIYARNCTAPTTQGTYSIIWDLAGVFVDEDLIVTYTTPGGALPSGTDLTTLGDVKNALEVTATTNDTLIQSLITAASRAITSRYQREFCPMGTLTRTFQVDGDYVNLAPYDLQSISAISLYPEGTPQAVVRYTDYDLRPVGQTTLGTYTSVLVSGFLVITGSSVFRYGYANLAITGVWGAPVIPPDIARACIVTVASWRDRAVSQYAIQGIEAGRDMTPDQFTTYSIPSAAHYLCKPYERMSYV